METSQLSVFIVFFLIHQFCHLPFCTLDGPSRNLKLLHGLFYTGTRCLEELNNLDLGGDVYLAPFTLIEAHSVVHFDGNKLKNERKCTPSIEK